VKANAKPDGTEISVVTRQMSPNSAFPEVTPAAFRSLEDFLAAYSTTDKMIADLTGNFVGAADLAKQKQDEIVPHLAVMQSLLSKKGKNHRLVIKACKKGHKIPWWSSYYANYKDRLWESLRTMERRIAEYRHDPSLPKKKRPKPSPHFNVAARRALIEANHTAVELVKALESGRDGRSEIAAFKQVMNAKRLDDILTTVTEESARPRPEPSEAAEALKSALAAEPDRDIASKLLTDYLQTVANEFGNDRIQIKDVSARVEFAGRSHRIMTGDFLEKHDRNATSILCKCTGVAEFMQRRRVQEWNNFKWEKEHVLFSAAESDYRVISIELARKIAPKAFDTVGL